MLTTSQTVRRIGGRVCGADSSALTLTCHPPDLSHTFGSRNYVVFRLVSDRSNVDVGRFRSAVLNFPPLLDADEGNLDDGLPGVAEVFRACYAMKFWLDQSPSHVAIVHDTHGRSRSPFFIACFLAWEHAHEFHVCVVSVHRLQ